MPTADTTEQPPSVAKPPHRLSELTTYELRDYRRELENAIASFGRRPAVPAARRQLQARLDAVAAEQDERERIRRANR